MASTPDSGARATADDGEPLQIVIVARDPDMQAYVSACVAAHGRPVHIGVVTRAAAVVSGFDEPRPDLVVADADGASLDEFAEMTGLYRALRARAVPLLLLADEPARLPHALALPDPRCAVIAKPFNARALCAEVDRLLLSVSGPARWDSCAPEPPEDPGERPL